MLVAYLVFSALAIFMRISIQKFSWISLQAQHWESLGKQDALQKEHLQATCLLETLERPWLSNEEMRLLSKAASVTHIFKL